MEMYELTLLNDEYKTDLKVNTVQLFPSSAVKIFPCSKSRGNYFPEVKLVTEDNFTKISSILPGMPSYIISNTDSVLCCAIKGYYIEIYKQELDDSSLLKSGYLSLNIINTGDTLGSALASWEGSAVDLDRSFNDTSYFGALCWTASESEPNSSVPFVSLKGSYDIATVAELQSKFDTLSSDLNKAKEDLRAEDKGILQDAKDHAESFTNRRLNEVVFGNEDGNGDPQTLAALSLKLTNEIIDRKDSDTTLKKSLENFATVTANSALSAAKSYTNDAKTAAINTANDSITALKDSLLGPEGDNSIDKETIRSVKNRVDDFKESLIGTSTDSAGEDTIKGLYKTIDGLKNRLKILEIHTEDLKHSPIMAIDGLKAWVTATIIDKNSTEIKYFQDAVSFEALSTFSFLPTLRNTNNAAININWYKDKNFTILVQDETICTMDLLVDRNFYAPVDYILTCHLIGSSGEELSKPPIHILYTGGAFPNPNIVFSEYGAINSTRWYNSSDTKNGNAITTSHYMPMSTVTQSMHIYACKNK